MDTLKFFCTGVAFFAASAALAADSRPEHPIVTKVRCLCQGDLRQALRAETAIPAAAVSADSRSLLSRLYRDGYRPVRYNNRTFWCRHEPIATGTNFHDQVRCVNSTEIAFEFSTSNFPFG